jgi:NAD(P)-dependent dehydrogenase (short-subunit alcohol dehydrogenase family)
MLGWQSGSKVFIVMGANSGVGLVLVEQLYKTGATIYLTGRSPTKPDAAIRDVQSVSPPPSTPATPLKPRVIDSWIFKRSSPPPLSPPRRPGSIAFRATRVRVHPAGAVADQGIEAHMGTNCIAPMLLIQELLPFFKAAVRSTPKYSVRVIRSSSIQKERSSPSRDVEFECRISTAELLSRSEKSAL